MAATSDPAASEASDIKGTLIDRPDWLESRFYPFQSRRIEVEGHSIHYIDEGQGPVILLLHGNGSWSYGFRLTIPKLAAYGRVIALDYPGMGLSKAGPGFLFLPEEQSSVVESFIDQLGLREITLCVEDWAGPIGLGVAGRRPELFRSLVITNTWAWPAQGSPSLERFSKLAGSFIGRFLILQFNLLARVAVPNTAFARKMADGEARAYWMPYSTTESRMAQATFPREILGSHTYLSRVEAGLDDLQGKPVLLIWGEQDPAFGEAEFQRWLQHFNHATAVRLPEAKHFVHVDEPEAVANGIIDFMDKNRGA